MDTTNKRLMYWICIVMLAGFIGYSYFYFITYSGVGLSGDILNKRIAETERKRSITRLASNISKDSAIWQSTPNRQHLPCKGCNEDAIDGEPETMLQKSERQMLPNERNPSKRMEITQRIQNKRLQLLQQGCRQYRNYDKRTFMDLDEFTNTKSNMNSFTSVSKYQFIYNFVHKVGSSSINKMIKAVTGTKGQRMYRMSSDRAKEMFRDYTTFIFVRHPLARLLSAYRDKFVSHHIPHYISVRRGIIKATRPNVTKDELRRADDVTFLEFIKFITGAPKSRRGNTHWSSLLLRNKVCDVRHDFIGKLETMDDDMNFLMKKMLHIENWELRTAYANSSNSSGLLQSYYSTIPEELLQKIYQYYEPDFKLFGYEMKIPM